MALNIVIIIWQSSLVIGFEVIKNVATSSYSDPTLGYKPSVSNPKEKIPHK